MRLKPALHRAAIWGERAFDRAFPAKAPENPVLDAYRGYGEPGGLVLRARVLASLRRTTPDPTHSRWQNLKEMASLFLTHEVADVTVRVVESGVTAASDEEGYVTLRVPGEFAPGWHDVPLEIVDVPDSRVVARALVPQADARLGIVSDIDDTLIQTGAYSLAKNMWTTFTGSATTRRVFADATVLLDHLSGHGRNPVFYVSSSPWNLHAFLGKVFDRAGLVPGPIFLRDLGISEDKFITSGHGNHKGRAIDRIMAANPDLPFVLIGDTGQHDAEIYLEACHRHGGRIEAVILREPGPGADDASRNAISAMRRLGVIVAHGTDFGQVAEELERGGLRI